MNENKQAVKQFNNGVNVFRAVFVKVTFQFWGFED